MGVAEGVGEGEGVGVAEEAATYVIDKLGSAGD